VDRLSKWDIIVLFSSCTAKTMSVSCEIVVTCDATVCASVVNWVAQVFFSEVWVLLSSAFDREDFSADFGVFWHSLLF